MYELALIQNLSIDTKAIESGEHGFVITGNEDFFKNLLRRNQQHS